MSRTFLVGVLFLANVFAWSIPVPHGLSVSFLDVGHGRATLLTGPRGAAVLVDGGPDSSVLREIGQKLPFFVRSLDGVIATDADTADVGGLSGVFRRYTVGAFIGSDVSSDTKAAIALESVVDAFHVKRITARAGMRIMLGKGAYADILSPGVVRVTYGHTSFLLPGNATQKVQKQLVARSDLESGVLEVPHYGSKDSLSQDFLHAVAPQYAVISYGCQNRWGYPAPGILQTLGNSGAQIVTTCESGTVTFVSDGEKIFTPL